MVSRENRVIAGSFVLFVLAIVGLFALENATGVPVSDNLLVTFLVVYGLPVVLPQLYLAATGGGDISSRTRVQFAIAFIGLNVFLLASIVDVLEPLQYRLLAAIAVAAFGGLLCYEALAGYRSSMADTAP